MWAAKGVGGVVCSMVPSGPVSVTRYRALEFEGDLSPGVAGLAFGDADQEEREPADQDVGADAVLEAVEDGP